MEKKNKKSIIIGITCLTLVTLLLLGLTYAYYRTRIVGNPNSESINLVTKKLGISYVDNQAVITATGIEPGYNNEAKPKTFTVHNTGDEAGTFNIIIDNVVNEFTKGTATRGEYNDWTYELYEGTTISSDTLLKSGEITSEEKQVLINNVFIDAQNEITYTLIIRYAELTNVDQSDDMGSKLSIRVNIEEGTISGDDTQENPLFESQPGTLLYALKTNNEITAPLTTPGVEASLENEAVFAATEDDYGTSYYFRGNVKNNYLNYSGMCWRIVRVDGNGNIKITLASEDGECEISTEYDDGFGFVDEYNAAAFIGSSGWEATPFSSSTFEFEVVQNWATDILLDTTNLIEEAEWCEDYSIDYYHDDREEDCVDYDEDGENDECYPVGDMSIYYGSSNTPTLKCDMVGLDNSKAIVTKSIVGALTRDEIQFAGAGKNSNTHYLMDNATAVPNSNGKDSSYLTITPDAYAPRSAGGMIYVPVDSDGSIGYIDFENIYYRPAVVLKNTVTAITDSTSQYAPGTYQNPYKVN